MQLCERCTRRLRLYNAARYAKSPKPWPRKDLCAKCRAALRETRRLWRREWVSRNREQVNEAQRAYRKRLKRAV